jgi:hypothetical protein
MSSSWHLEEDSSGLSSDLAMLDHVWVLEMGALKNLVSVVAIDKGTLVLEASSHAAMQDVLLRRRELVRKINQHFSSPLVHHMTVRISQDNGR